jgi:hypothetical protein
MIRSQYICSFAYIPTRCFVVFCGVNRPAPLPFRLVTSSFFGGKLQDVRGDPNSKSQLRAPILCAFSQRKRQTGQPNPIFSQKMPWTFCQLVCQSKSAEWQSMSSKSFHLWFNWSARALRESVLTKVRTNGMYLLFVRMNIIAYMHTRCQ